MGSTKLRRLFKSECKWTDKTAKKHKHIFNIHAIMQLRNMNNHLSYYDIMKCEFCNSFISIPKEGAINGFIKDDKYDKNLPMIKLYKSHKYTIGFDDAILDKEDNNG